MIKTILLPVTGSQADTLVFDTALSLARKFGAHLHALHVRQDPLDQLAVALGDITSGAAAGQLIEELEQTAREREVAARRNFLDFCRREGVDVVTGNVDTGKAGTSATWNVEVGDEAHWTVAHARTSDVMVVGRSPESLDGTGSMLEAALFDSGRPLFIPGTQPISWQTVAIAWKPTREAARAVSASLPFLEPARKAVVLTAEEQAPGHHASAERLAASLQRHGLTVETRHLGLALGHGTVAARLLAAAADAGAGLLVMGGYGHSRVREWIFGGVTDHVLRHAAIPVLMTH